MNVYDAMNPDEFLRELERQLGRRLAVPPPRGPGDDCPICRALGLDHEDPQGVTTIEGMTIVTMRMPRDGH